MRQIDLGLAAALVPAIAAIDILPFNRYTDQPFNLLDLSAQRVAILRSPRKCLQTDNELIASSMRVGYGDRGLYRELLSGARLALGDAFDLWGNAWSLSVSPAYRERIRATPSRVWAKAASSLSSPVV